MILDRRLTAAERRFSQTVLRDYWILSALAMTCCSDAVLPLLGMALKLPDAVLSLLGAMNYACFLLLPLGFLLGSRIGAGKSMAWENFLMFLATLLLAVSLWLGKWSFFIGFLLFWTARAANFAMRFALQKNIAVESEMPAMLARNYIGLYAATLLGSLGIAAICRIFPGPRTLAAVLFVGALLWGAVALCIRRIKESESVKKLAVGPWRRQIMTAWRTPLVRHQVCVGTLLNCFLAAVVPVNILAAKRGLHVSDALVVLLTAVQAVSAIGGSVLVKEISARFGPRKMMFWGYPLVWGLCASWCLLPMQNCPWLLAVPFVLGGISLTVFGASLENYFLLSVPDRLQLGGTFLVFVVTGGGAGVLGMLFNFGIFKLAEFSGWDGGGSMTLFRFYFLCAGIIFAAGCLAPWSLPDKTGGTREKG